MDGHDLAYEEAEHALLAVPYSRLKKRQAFFVNCICSLDETDGVIAAIYSVILTGRKARRPRSIAFRSYQMKGSGAAIALHLAPRSCGLDLPTSGLDLPTQDRAATFLGGSTVISPRSATGPPGPAGSQPTH